MKQSRLSKFARRSVGWRVAAAGLLVAAMASGMPRAQAQKAPDDTLEILKAMSDYVASQKNISLTYDTDIEVITPEVEKIQFTSSGKVLLSRPDKVRATRTGGYADVEIVFDGKTVSAIGKNVNVYTQFEA